MLQKLLKRDFFLIGIIVIGILFYFHQDWYLLFQKKKLDNLQLKELKTSGEKAIDHLDIPVAAIVLYNNKIIGRGYNTTLKNDNAGGHAEINAISDALQDVGHEEFSKLNRDSLQLITTYEPCLMCRGAIINYRIKHVSFIQEKSLREHFSYTLQNLKYDFYKQKTDQDTLQEYLFRKHPYYPHK